MDTINLKQGDLVNVAQIIEILKGKGLELDLSKHSVGACRNKIYQHVSDLLVPTTEITHEFRESLTAILDYFVKRSGINPEGFDEYLKQCERNKYPRSVSFPTHRFTLGVAAVIPRAGEGDPIYLSSLKQEQNMSVQQNPPAVETKAFIFGKESSAVSDQDIFDHIQTLEAKIEKLNSLQNKPQAATDEMARLTGEIDSLVKFANERTAAQKAAAKK